MKYSRNLVLLPLSLGICTGIQAQKTEDIKPAGTPNLVFIMADQWRGDALGCLNREPVKTPNLDALARLGVNFTQAVSSYPVSSPARGMLMTGMYPSHTGVPENCNSATARYGVELKQDIPCWSDVLSQCGYETGYIGKWHLDAPHIPYIDTYNNRGKVAWNEWTPPGRRHGFKHWIAYGTYDYHLKPMYWQTDDGRDDWKFVDQWGPEYEADRAIDYIANKDNVRNPEKPFALVVSINPPHTGYELVPDKYKAVYKDLDVDHILASRPDIATSDAENQKFFRQSIRDYYACMTGVDEQVGRIIRSLKEKGLFENTIVVFTSDHGDCMGMHNQKGKNVCYDNAMRIPLIITWPAEILPRQDDHTLIAFADLAPTMLSLMGERTQIPPGMQTFDLSDVITGKGKARAPKFQPYFRMIAGAPERGVRGLRDHRYTYAISFNTEPGNGQFTPSEEEINTPVTGKVYEVLYDRQTDPWQLKNIAGQNPGLCKKYRKKLKKFLETTNDTFYRLIK